MLLGVMDIIKSFEITDTAYGGYGVGRDPSGRVIFVTGTVEGDVVDVRISDDKKSFAYADLLAINKPSSYRVKPTCPKANKCGGCLFAHISYDAQINIKLKIIKNALRKLTYLPEITVHKSPQKGYRIRANVRSRNGATGFFGFKSNDFVTAYECPIIKSTLFEKIKDFAKTNSITGEILAAETPAGIVLSSVKAREDVMKSMQPFDCVRFNGASCGLKHSAYETPFGPIGIGCGSFFQSNVFLIDSFQEKAVSLIPAGLSVVELYAGAGFFTAGLAVSSHNVKAVEYDTEATRLAQVYGYPVVRGDAGDFLAGISSADCVFMDPPRDGVSNKVIAEIKRLMPLYVVYVSCSPATLARDVLKLANLYKIESIDFFDMFPDTYHAECVVLMSRSAGE